VTRLLILWITFFSLLGSIGALVTAAAFLWLPEKIQKVLIPCLVSYASGTLLAASLLGLIPQALKNTADLSILSTVLAGIVIFSFSRNW
jgi:zinc and cadmium transporter